uniref:GRIP domain-containing protein n=1 Tax=Macrostomum lignano TaxID=282301 RepID=A0A1I8FVN3_9PLAT
MPGVENQKRQQTQHVLYGDEYVSSELLSEYQTLQRQLKILESDRRLHSLEAAEVARQQRADLRRLEEENGELRRNLAAARSRSAKRERQAETSRLRELVGELEALEAEVRSVREAHMQLDAKIREARKRVRQTRVARGGTGAAAGAERSLQPLRQIPNYGVGERENARVARSSARDRQKFLSVRERLQAELQRIQRRRAGLTESATEAYRDSEDSRRRVRELQERENATAAEHALRVKLLYREIDLHDHIGSFMRAKLQHRETDPELRHLREELQRRQADERRSREADDESLRRSFDLMRRHYGAADLDGMVRCFLHAEDENFSLFRFCTTAQ